MFKRQTKKIALSILISAAFFVALCTSAFSGEKKKAIITAYDAYVTERDENDESATKYKETKVIAKLERDGALNINPDIEDASLSFYINGKLFDKAKTDDDGFAKLLLPVDAKNIRKFTAKLEGAEEYEADDDSGLIYMVDPKKPTIICDIDWTVSETDRSSLLLKSSDDESTPLKDAPETITALAEHYNIIFVTGREDALLKKTREWLRKWKFPELPVFYADFGQTPYIKQGEYKEKAVAKIKKDIKGTTIGIGDMPHDAEAYIKSGLKAYIIKKKDDLPEGAVVIPDWLSIKDELLKEENLTLK